MSRVVFQADALQWLNANQLTEKMAIVTSLPDFTELSTIGFSDWKNWFVKTSVELLHAVHEESVVIFYQRDAKHDGFWVDKSYLCSKAGETAGSHLLWHKIVARAKAGQTTFGRPGYSHLLCFSKKKRLALSVASPDIILSAGDSTWARGMGSAVCELAIDFIRKNLPVDTIVDPFCGHGSILAMANHKGLSAIGVDQGRKRVERAKTLSYDPKLGFTQPDFVQE